MTLLGLPLALQRASRPRPIRRARLLWLLVAGVTGVGGIGLSSHAAAASAARAAQALRSCPGTFTVLHNDRVGPLVVPAGAYSVRTTGVSCASASTLIARFLDDFDGVLPGGWTTPAAGIGFVNPVTGAIITLGPPKPSLGQEGLSRYVQGRAQRPHRVAKAA